MPLENNSSAETGAGNPDPAINHRSGYLVVSTLTYRAFNFFLALFLSILAAPFLIVLALALKLRFSGPLLYRGTRLGKDKKLFTMYKFRTLPVGSQSIIGAELLTQKIAAEKSLLTGLSKWLRDTRLDELPQLLNIIRGEMNFMGPRPERPEIYDSICRHIPGYDHRFQVKPGLIGYSQLFTPYNTPKEIRTHIDNKFLRKKNRFLFEITIILKTMAVVLLNVLRFPLGFLSKLRIQGWRLRIQKERRSLERTSLDRAFLFLAAPSNPDGEEIYSRIGTIADINEDALLVLCNEESFPYDSTIKLQIELPGRAKSRKKAKSAFCSARLYSRTEIKHDQYRYGYVLRYTPRSHLDYYMIHQYFLQRSIIRP